MSFAIDFVSLRESASAALALEAALKTTLVLAAGALLVASVRRSSAASRHFVWTMALVSALVMPVLVGVVPSFQVAMPALTGDRASLAKPANFWAPAAAEESWLALLRDANQALTVNTNSARFAMAPPPPDAARAPVPTSIPAGQVLGGIWFLGVTLVLARLAFGLARGRQLVRDSTAVALDPALASLSRDLGIRRDVCVRASARVDVPMTYGVLRPAVLVPAEFSTWSPERQRVVLLHELAHVARFDWLALIVAQVTLAVYWFHPLAWLGSARLRREAEEAADDRVLGTGARASAYASHLLAIARALGSTRPAPVAVVSMLGSRFERRVRAILDPDRARGGLTRPLGLAAAALLAGGVTLLAAIEVEAAAPDSDSPLLAMPAPAHPPAPPTLPIPPNPVIAGSVRLPLAVLADNLRHKHEQLRHQHEELRYEHEKLLEKAIREGIDGALADGLDCDNCDDDAYSRAYELHRKKRYQEAIAAFEKAIEARQRSGAASYNIACGYARLGQPDRALEWLEKAIERGFEVEDYLLSDSDLASLRGDARFQKLVAENGGDRIRNRAMRRLERLQQRRDADASDWYDAAMDLHNIGEYDRAIEAWQKSLEMDGNSGSATYNIACAKARKGDTNGALASLALAIERGYGGADHMREDDDLESLRGDPRFQELLAMAKALELPGVSGGREHEEFYRPSWRAAVTRYQDWLKGHPESGRGWFNLGFAALASGDPSSALDGFKRAFDLGYRKPVSAYNLACAHARKSNTDEAFVWLDRALELGFDNGGQLYTDPDLESLRDDARFKDLAERLAKDMGWRGKWDETLRQLRRTWGDPHAAEHDDNE